MIEGYGRSSGGVFRARELGPPEYVIPNTCPTSCQLSPFSWLLMQDCVRCEALARSLTCPVARALNGSCSVAKPQHDHITTQSELTARLNDNLHSRGAINSTHSRKN